jgi:hypothetical protein
LIIYTEKNGLIHILRNPRDVLLNNARYSGAYKNARKLEEKEKSIRKKQHI